MKVSKEEFVKNILKMKIKRERKKENQTISTLRENVNRCRKMSNKRHIKITEQL